MGIIYKITNILNNKIYIGQTRQSNPKRRWDRHISDSKNPSTYLQYALNKHGVDKFIFEIILSSLDNEYLDNYEKILIKQYNSIDKQFGYNLTSGGNYCDMNQEVKNKISKSKLGSIPWNKGKESPKVKGLTPWNKGMKGQYRQHSNFGINLSKKFKGISKTIEHRNNLSLAKKEYYKNNTHCQAKQVYWIQGNITFISVQEAANFFKCKNAHIARVCRKERNSFKNNNFEYR